MGDLTLSSSWRIRNVMAVRFVIGRAGAGKTAHCLRSVQAALGTSPLAGGRLILLVPEQASLQVERALIGGLEQAAAHRAEVLSFRRLATAGVRR